MGIISVQKSIPLKVIFLMYKHYLLYVTLILTVRYLPNICLFLKNVFFYKYQHSIFKLFQEKMQNMLFMNKTTLPLAVRVRQNPQPLFPKNSVLTKENNP